MNANLTISTLSFNQTYSDKGGSERRETSRGVSLPEVMTVKHQDITDSATKKPATRSLVRFDRHVALTDGTIAPVSAYIVVQVPKDTAVVSSDILAVVARLAQVVSLATPVAGLELGPSVFVNKEQ